MEGIFSSKEDIKYGRQGVFFKPDSFQNIDVYNTMKFSLVYIIASAAFISQALATPAPQGGNTVYHCAPIIYQPTNGADHIYILGDGPYVRTD